MAALPRIVLKRQIEFDESEKQDVVPTIERNIGKKSQKVAFECLAEQVNKYSDKLTKRLNSMDKTDQKKYRAELLRITDFKSDVDVAIKAGPSGIELLEEIVVKIISGDLER